MMAILALCIIIGIIVVIYALLRFSVRISYSFDSTAKNKASVIVKYFFFTLYENPESEKRKKAKAKKLAKKEKKIEKKKASKKPAKEKEPPRKDIVDEINDLSKEETEQKIIELEKEISEQKELYNESVKKASIKEQKKTNKAPKPKKQGKLSQIKEKWNMIKPYAPLTWKTLRRLLKKIRFYNTEIDIMLGNEDPYKAAVNYGYANMAFYQSLAFLCMIFSIKIKSCDLNTEFTEKKLEVKFSGNVYIRVSTILGILLCYGVKMLKIYLSKRSKKSTDKKQDKELLKNEQ
ncbi:MAG: hypothetical protein LIO41_06285 [Ruminococcus sp.]|nr:hypothetical protein [Ruminococcus sp.]